MRVLYKKRVYLIKIYSLLIVRRASGFHIKRMFFFRNYHTAFRTIEKIYYSLRARILRIPHIEPTAPIELRQAECFRKGNQRHGTSVVKTVISVDSA